MVHTSSGNGIDVKVGLDLKPLAEFLEIIRKLEYQSKMRRKYQISSTTSL